jgi:hypothetical protein
MPFLALRAASSGGLCAEVQGALPLPGAGTEVTMVACNSTSPTQLFAYLSNGTLVLQGQPSHCLNLEAYGKLFERMANWQQAVNAVRHTDSSLARLEQDGKEMVAAIVECDPAGPA